MKTDGILLDVDGTLWDSTGAVTKSWNEALREEGVDDLTLTRAAIRGQFGKTMQTIAHNLFGRFPKARQDRLMQVCCRRENEQMRGMTESLLYPGVRETLESLSRSVSLFIVSNCQSGYIELLLEKNRLQPFITDFECYGNTGLGKGENIRLVVKRNHLNVPVYVGDTDGDRQAAEEAGVPFIFAAYGFGRPERYAARIDAFTQLPSIVQAQPAG